MSAPVAASRICSAHSTGSNRINTQAIIAVCAAIAAAHDEVATVDRPAVPGPEVRELGVDPIQRHPLIGAVPDRPVRLGLGGEVGGVTVADLGEVAVGGELVFGVLADRLQHPVAGVPGTVVDGDQRLADQGIQHVEHRVLVQPDLLTEVGGRREVEPVGEHRTPAQHRPFVVVEQVEGPAHRVAQRLMTFQAAT